MGVVWTGRDESQDKTLREKRVNGYVKSQARQKDKQAVLTVHVGGLHLN